MCNHHQRQMHRETGTHVIYTLKNDGHQYPSQLSSSSPFSLSQQIQSQVKTPLTQKVHLHLKRTHTCRTKGELETEREKRGNAYERAERERGDRSTRCRSGERRRQWPRRERGQSSRGSANNKIKRFQSIIRSMDGGGERRNVKRRPQRD